MGNSSKKTKQTTSVFDEAETEKLNKLFNTISGGGKDAFNYKQFKEYLQPVTLETFPSRLFDYMVTVTDREGDKKLQENEKLVTRSNFLKAVGIFMKGSSSEVKAKILLHMIGDEKIKSLKLLLDQFLRLAESSMTARKEYLSWKFQPKFSDSQFLNNYTFDLVIRDGKQQCDVKEGLPPDGTFSRDDVELWLSRNPVLGQLMNLAYCKCFPISSVSCFMPLLPQCYVSESRDSHAGPITILDLWSVIFINSALPHEMCSEWRLLYSTVLHGASFATMLKKILDEGPTVFVIKDHGGHVFGGFASESWKAFATFYGSSTCFLFSLLPVMDVYIPTGYNSNFMYLNQNQQTLPNGMGMGGQWNYAGLWIEQEYGKGHSKAKPKCTTYNSPQLSSEPEFSFDFMEVWSVGPKPTDPNADPDAPRDSKKKSGVLLMDAETKAMMEMIGKRQHSEAIRQADAQADDTAGPK